MRLTLRTLLAYLDGILEPNDAQDIGKKIEESEVATGLVHRIRDVMRRMRLGSPDLADRNERFDPNTVAEYLDNTLASDGVADFEKVCLDSDIHLAEVASCHQILTLVLGEPVEIDPASRQSMYQIKDAQAAAPVSSAPNPTPIAPSPNAPPTLDLHKEDGDSAARKPRAKPTVPEYLRESQGRGHWLSTAISVAVVIGFTVVILMVLGQFEPGTPFGDVLIKAGLVAPAEKVALETEPSPESDAIESSSALPADKGTEASPSAESDKKAEKDTPQKEPAKEPEAAKPETTKSEASKPEAAQPAAEVKKEPIKVASNASPAKEPSVLQMLPKGIEKAVDVAPTAKQATEPKTRESGEKDKPVAAPPALPPEPLGRLMSSDQVLLKDSSNGGWTRIAANQMLFPQRLLALPTYRVKVTLTVGVTMEILGGTQIELLPSSQQELPGIRIIYGRVIMMPLAQAGSKLRIVFGDHTGIITFSNAESIAALEVRRIQAPGTNPEAEPSHMLADLYASFGGIQWTEIAAGVEGKKQLLAPQQKIQFNLDAVSEPIASKEMPRWITVDPISALDRRASVAIAAALPVDRLARLGLLELTTTRPQKEVKWLALRCLSYIGQHRDLVTALNDAARKPDWPDYIDQLREAVARDAESAAGVRLALEKQYPEQAKVLYRMLWGYSNKDLAAGEDAKLVKALDDDTLAVRVLSFWNLKDLTGVGLFYRPEQPAIKRQPPMLRWRQRLEAQEIRLKTAEEKADAAAGEKPAPTAKSL